MSLSASTIWIIVGIALLIGEMLSASFFMLFISLGAFAAALVASFEAPLFAQLALCAVVAVLGILVLRKPIQRKLLKNIKVSSDVGTEIILDQGIAPHQQTRITYQGTSWLATNLESEPLRAGERVMIEGIDGNVLLIRKVN